MQYAAISCANEDQVPWLFDIPINTWKFWRTEDNGAIQCYIGLKGVQFTDEQKGVINDLSGFIGTDEEFLSWRDANGDPPYQLI